MKNIYTILLVSVSLVCFGQKQNNNWCFGNHAAVTFNSGTAVSFSGGATSNSSLEGVSAISDASGNLLCYTDGSTVWNKTNTPMPNGTGLLGNFSTSEGALIVPQPGNDSIYYVFCLDQVNGPNGLHYSVVDMNLNGGMGDVSQRNIPLDSGTLYTEKMIGIFHSNGTDVWVIVHVSYTNTFHAYLVTSAGVSATPVSTSIGQTYGSTDAVGTMHCTLDGTRIAASYWGTLSGYEVFDFDKSTGHLSNPLYITSANYYNAYSVCFSPSGRYLYGGCFNTNKIYQFDLHDSLPVGGLIESTVSEVGDLQLGPDSIIYCSLYIYSYLSAIEKPDSAGLACNFVTNAVSLGSGSTAIGLTNYIYPTGVAIAPPVAQFSSTDSSFCVGNCTGFTNLSQKAVSYLWRFPGGIPSSDTSVNPASVCYYDTGTYDVTLIATNSGGTDSVTFTNYIKVNAAPPAPTLTNVGFTIYCSYDSSYASYQWYDSATLIPGATDTFLVITNGGNYNMQVTGKDGCKIAVGINVITGIQDYSSKDFVSIFPNPAANELTIHASLINQNETVTVSIMNVLGQEVIQLAISNGQSVIDVSSLSSGIYFLQLKTERGSVVKKFVKE